VSKHIKSLTLPEILQIPPKLYPIITDFNDYIYYLLEGGRGSAKSQSIARLLLYLGEVRKLRIVCGREIQANIEESVHAILADLIEQYGLAYEVLKREIRHLTSGTTFTFKGFREQGNVSVKGLEGVDVLWIDEAQSITKPTLDIILPTIRKERSRCFFTMNRYMREDAVPEQMVGNKDCLHIVINYHDNPFCPLNLKVQAENTRNRSERDYNHIWLGHPLAQADDYLFNFEKLIAAYNVQSIGDIYQRQRILAIDFAAQGNDQCVATVLDRTSNQHWKLSERLPWDEPDTMISVGKIVNLIGQFRPDVTIIDIGGLGKPVFDRLLEVGMNVQPFDGGSTQGVDTKQHINKRAQGYFALRDWFDSGFLQIDRRDGELIKQLEKIKFKYRSNGSRLIQSKVDMKKELKYSPDDADSLMMAVYAAVHHLGQQSNTASAGNGKNLIKRVSGSKRPRAKTIRK
jgi:phage terminase large subunit